MIHYIYLIAAICFSAMLSIMAAVFNRKNQNSDLSALYNVIYMGSAFLCWSAMYVLEFSFKPRVLLYSAAYGLFYALALTGLFKALACGSVSLTSFIKQLSLVGVAIWGFVFWDSPFTFTIAAALILIAVSLFLCLKPSGKKSGKAVSFKWLIYVLMLFAGNAGCSIVQKYQQLHFHGRHGNMLMCFGTGFAVILCMLLIFKRGKANFKAASKGSLVFPVIAGVSSALLNLIILFLATSPLSPSLIYPAIAVGGMVLSVLFSVIACRERLFKIQWVGLSVGIVSLILLNL